MASSTAVRSLRNGAIVVKDGDSPVNSHTLHCDDGNLTWTIARNYVDQKCRGVTTGRIKGDDQPCEFSFTAKATQLVSASYETNELYEMLMDDDENNFVSVEDDHYALDVEFTIVDPADPTNENGTGELILFESSCFPSVQYSEGESNTIQVSGRMLGDRPVVTRIPAA